MIKIKVFISSPYTIGDKEENVKRSMKVADELIELGFIPFIPLLFHYQNELHPRDEKTWLDLDLDWLESCDCVFRLSGESNGADRECDYADKMCIPVFRQIDRLIRFRENK